MRRKIAAGNWKMNPTSLTEAQELTTSILKGQDKNPVKADQLILAPPFPFLSTVISLTAKHLNVGVAAQNCHEEGSGAYTGESSASMLKSMGTSHVLIGHSERRAYFAESNAALAQKIDQAILHDLIPVFCCGESLEERKSGQYKAVIRIQIEESLFHLPENHLSRIIIAYEPVWAIGTGETASPAQAQEVHAYIREVLATKYPETAANTSILYGGSVKPTNATAIFSQPDVDGGLVGGASLKAADFLAIANSF